MRTFMSVIIVSSILHVLSFQAVLAAEPCDDDPLMPRIDKMMKKRLPLTLAWKLNPDKAHKDAVNGIWESEKTFLIEIHKLRERACGAVLEIQSDTDILIEGIKSINRGKNCEDTVALNENYSKLSSIYKTASDELVKQRQKLVLLYQTYISKGAYLRFNEVLTAEGSKQAKQIAAIIVEQEAAWSTKNPNEFIKKEGIDFFDHRILHFNKLRNDAELQAGTMRIQLQDLECDRAKED